MNKKTGGEHDRGARKWGHDQLCLAFINSQGAGLKLCHNHGMNRVDLDGSLTGYGRLEILHYA